MKKYLITIILFLYFGNTYAQNQNWITVNNFSPNFSFSCPQNPFMVDSLRTKYYYYKLDTVIGFQVHIIDNAKFDRNNEIFNEALVQTNGDTLRAITKITLTLSNSELTSIQDVNISNRYRGLEIGLKYNDLVSNRSVFSFIRFFRNDSVFISFTITGYEDDLTRLVSNKNLFFNSISF